MNEIVWPEIWRLAQEKIQEAHSKGFGVCVVDAAVMLKAGWDKYVHEIWVTIVPKKEVIYIFFSGLNVGLVRVCLLSASLATVCAYCWWVVYSDTNVA